LAFGECRGLNRNERAKEMLQRTAKPIQFDTPYATHRRPTLARNVVSTSQPLAAQAGLRMLLAGGNAMDAALAAAITLTVVEPSANAIGGDLFAIVWDGTELSGLNASGRSPAALTPERFHDRSSIPSCGWDAVTVHGAVSGWVELSRRFSRFSLERLVAPAVSYARDGSLVGAITADNWSMAPEMYAGFDDFARGFLPN